VTVSPLRARLDAAALACRNENVRRVELAWDAAISSELAYFVTLGVFAYEAGGAAAVGLAEAAVHEVVGARLDGPPVLESRSG
jgi:hypothetical protein